jgi:hypothetical protein
MNPPDSKPSMNPNSDLKFYDLGCGFMAGTGEPGNWKSLVTLVTLVSWLSRSTIPTGNRSTRPLWPSMILARGTIPLEYPDSGHADHQVGSGVSRFGNCGEPSDSGCRCFSLMSPPKESTLILADSTNEALGASVLNDFARLHDAPGNLLSRRWRRGSASQPPTLEPLALAIS